jgi:lactoylglutathione lyase
MTAWAIVGPRHAGITVSDLDRSLALYEELRGRGVRFRSDGPVEMTAGANAGGKSLYALDPDGSICELHERPPG